MNAFPPGFNHRTGFLKATFACWYQLGHSSSLRFFFVYKPPVHLTKSKPSLLLVIGLSHYHIKTLMNLLDHFPWQTRLYELFILHILFWVNYLGHLGQFTLGLLPCPTTLPHYPVSSLQATHSLSWGGPQRLEVLGTKLGVELFRWLDHFSLVYFSMDGNFLLHPFAFPRCFACVTNTHFRL